MVRGDGHGQLQIWLIDDIFTTAENLSSPPAPVICVDDLMSSGSGCQSNSCRAAEGDAPLSDPEPAGAPKTQVWYDAISAHCILLHLIVSHFTFLYLTVSACISWYLPVSPCVSLYPTVSPHLTGDY